MRRLLTSLLLVLISFSLVSPVLASIAKSGAPACCLRGGKHHCAMGAPASSHSGPALRVACPFQSHGSLAASSSQKSFLVSRSALVSTGFHAARLQLLRDSHAVQHRITVHGQRGPPSHFD